MQQDSQTQMIGSQREELPLSFRYPGHWQAKELPRMDEVKVHLRGPVDPDENLFASIAVRAWPSEEHTPRELTRQWIERRSAFRTFRILARTETTVAGTEAIQVDAVHDVPLPLYVVDAKMVPVQERVIFTVHEGKAYQLTYRAVQEDFDNHLHALDDVLASLSLETYLALDR